MSELCRYVLLSFWQRFPHGTRKNSEQAIDESKLKASFMMSRSTNVISKRWIREKPPDNYLGAQGTFKSAGCSFVRSLVVLFVSCVCVCDVWPVSLWHLPYCSHRVCLYREYCSVVCVCVWPVAHRVCLYLEYCSVVCVCVWPVDLLTPQVRVNPYSSQLCLFKPIILFTLCLFTPWVLSSGQLCLFTPNTHWAVHTCLFTPDGRAGWHKYCPQVNYACSHLTLTLSCSHLLVHTRWTRWVAQVLTSGQLCLFTPTHAKLFTPACSHQMDALDGTDPRLAAPPTPPKLCEDEGGAEDCERWAAGGECEGNPGFMHRSCAGSCGTCGEASQHVELWDWDWERAQINWVWIWTSISDKKWTSFLFLWWVVMHWSCAGSWGTCVARRRSRSVSSSETERSQI